MILGKKYKNLTRVCFSCLGTDVVIVKNGRRICGTGGCLASAPLHQNKSYFEFKIQSTGLYNDIYLFEGFFS